MSFADAGRLGITALVLIFSVGLVLFLGGLSSAAWEIRGERKRGVPVTRPGWELREKRKAVGGWWARAKLSWATARLRAAGGAPLCWCGRGICEEFPALPPEPAAIGCAAWEAGDPEAVRRHDLAGGYSRTPIGS